MKSKLSLTYLILGTLALIGFIAFFNRWAEPLLSLFILAIPFYIMTLTFTIFIHPIICTVYLVRRSKKSQNTTFIKVHLIWSLLIAGAFWGMILNGYIITV